VLANKPEGKLGLPLVQPDCIFCKIINATLPAHLVFEDRHFLAFLDDHPLFPGHVLLCPRDHYETLVDLPPELGGDAMASIQLLSRAVEAALDTEGIFVAVNNRVSQSVPHLHIHIVPRRRRDGLKGFFWPRQKYLDEDAKEAVRDAIEREVRKLR
jgi:histidine triad (HIT) family protein